MGRVCVHNGIESWPLITWDQRPDLGFSRYDSPHHRHTHHTQMQRFGRLAGPPSEIDSLNAAGIARVGACGVQHMAAWQTPLRLGIGGMLSLPPMIPYQGGGVSWLIQTVVDV